MEDMDLNKFSEKVLVIVTSVVIIAGLTYIMLRHRGLDWKSKYTKA
jgi:hypothetical protein